MPVSQSVLVSVLPANTWGVSEPLDSSSPTLAVTRFSYTSTGQMRWFAVVAPNGDLLSQEFNFGTNNAGAFAIELGGGNFALFEVLTVDHVTGAGTTRIHFVDSSGMEYSPSTTLNVPVYNATELSNGTIALTWFEKGVAENSSKLLGQLINSNGEPIGGAVDISGDTLNINASRRDSIVTAREDGTYSVFWKSDVSNELNPISQLYSAIFSSDGTQIGNVHSQTAKFPSNLDAVQLSNGSIVQTWRSEGTIWARFLEKNGEYQGNAFKIAEGTIVPNYGAFISASALASGKFVVSWSAKYSVEGGYYAAVFDNSGDRITQPFWIKNTPGYISDTPFQWFYEEADGTLIFVHETPNSRQRVSLDITKFTGTSLAEHWTGTDANDLIHGGKGADILSGGLGDDFVYGDSGDDILLASLGSDVLDGGVGSDTVSFAELGAISLALDGGFQSEGDVLTSTLASFENVIGSDTGNDRLRGDAGANRLIGLGGDDIIQGVAGDDILVGGTGADILNGGIGSDTADYSSETSRISVYLAEPSRNSGAAANDRLISIENVIGTNAASDKLTGDANSNTLTGLGGNDVLVGLAGDDKLFGGNGNDLLFGSFGDDVLSGGTGIDSFMGSSGSDTVTYADKYLRVTVNLVNTNLNKGEALGDTFSSIENIVGSGAGDTLIGDSRNNLLDGGIGRDLLFGGAGDDILIGGIGNDYLKPGTGRDRIDGGRDIDKVDFTGLNGVAVFLNGATSRRGVHSNYVVTNVEDLVGSKGNDYIIDNSLRNFIKGMAGDDIIFSSSGGDNLDGGVGRDRLDFYYSKGVRASMNDRRAEMSGTLVSFEKFEELFGSNTGNDTIFGSMDDDLLGGHGGSDILVGYAGNDTLMGGAGADTLDGGSGYDIASYADTAAIVLDMSDASKNAGNVKSDTLLNIEGFAGSDSGNDKLYGNSKDNTLFGNGGNDLLVGRSGDDLLRGGKGNDTLDGGEGSDIADFSDLGSVKISLSNPAGNSVDRLISIEGLIGSDVGNDHLTGDSGENYLDGGGGIDKLFGKGGSDIIIGGAGRDQLWGGSSVDGFYYGSLTDFGDKIFDFESSYNASNLWSISYKMFEQSDYFIFSKSVIHEAVGSEILSDGYFIQKGLWRIGNTNSAMESNDYFILRKSDSTLWFDKDATGKSAPILVADLPDGTLLGFANFYFI